MNGQSVHREYHGWVRDDVIPHVPSLGGTILDVGGGNGATAARLKALGHANRVGVVDMVKDTHGLDFSYGGDVEDQEFIRTIIVEQGPFEIILCLDLLEHLVDPWSLVATLHTGLATNGVLVASIPNVRNYTALMPLLFRNKWELTDAGILDRTHLRFFVRSTAIELVTCSGLELRSIHASPTGGRKVSIIRGLTFGWLNSFTDRQYILCAARPRV